MRIRDVASFIAFAVMIAFGAGYVGDRGVRIAPPSDRTNVSMKVGDVNSLVVGSNVLLQGVPVGKVSKIETALDGATVDFYIGGQYRVPVDSDVRLGNLSALGESYIGLVPRRQDGPMLHDGQRIATESVIAPPSISELSTSVVRVLNQLDPGALQRVITEADTALPAANSVLPNLSYTGRILRNRAEHMNGTGRALLSNFQTLLRNAGWLGPVVAGMTPGIQRVGPRLQETVGAFEYLIYRYNTPYSVLSLNKLLDRIQKLLDDNGSDLKELGEAFLPKVKGIAGALLNFDPSQIMANILATVPQDGTITLHVAVPNR